MASQESEWTLSNCLCMIVTRMILSLIIWWWYGDDILMIDIDDISIHSIHPILHIFQWVPSSRANNYSYEYIHIWKNIYISASSLSLFWLFLSVLWLWWNATFFEYFLCSGKTLGNWVKQRNVYKLNKALKFFVFALTLLLPYFFFIYLINLL